MQVRQLIYKVGCSVGIGVLALKFIIYSENIDFFAIGYLILGVTLLANYYFNGGRLDQLHFWWQNIVDFCFLFFSVYYQFDLNKYWNIPLSLFAFILLGLKYLYLRFRGGKDEDNAPKKGKRWNTHQNLN